MERFLFRHGVVNVVERGTIHTARCPGVTHPTLIQP